MVFLMKSKGKIFEKRLQKTKEILREKGMGGLILSPGPNQFYLSGFFDEIMERHLFLIISENNDPLFFIPKLYENQIKDEAVVENIHTWSDDEDPLIALENLMKNIDLPPDKRILFDDRMWLKFFNDIDQVINFDFQVGLASEVLTQQRILKDEMEIESVRKASKIADDVSEEIRELELVGMSENELANEIEKRMLNKGAEEIPFDTISSSGPNCAKPHHRHSSRAIEEGDPVILDFGCRVENYISDQTRTVVAGNKNKAPERFSSVFQAVKKAHDAALNKVEPGIKANMVDKAARNVLEEKNLGDKFTHRTGHGVGLEVHESPYIGSENEMVLKPGMIFSIEPGVYFPNQWGVRVEDLVLVTETGVKKLNHSTYDWTNIDK